MDIAAMVASDQLRYVATIFAFSLFCCLLTGKFTSRRKLVGKTCPQPSLALPLIGHLHLLKEVSKPFAHTLGDMTDKSGHQVFMLRLGVHPTLIVNGWEAAKECLTTIDKALATRITNDVYGKYLGFDHAIMIFAPYGAYWRSLRRIATFELLSNARIKTFKHVRSMEVDACIKDLYKSWVENGPESALAVDMKQWLGDVTYNVVMNMVAGKRYFGSAGGSEEACRFRSSVGQFFSLLGAFVPADMFPFLKWFGLSGNERAMKAAAQELDTVMSGLLEEHRLKNSSEKVEGDRDFMDVLLSTVPKDAELCREFDSDKIIKATSLTAILGGADTTSVTLIWTIAALVNNKRVMKKVQDELDDHVGRERTVEESDVKKLVYLQAVIKEVLRLYPPFQILFREAIEDCCVAGHTVPRGTRILVNVWKLQQDPRIWEDPLEFMPERFLTNHSGVDFSWAGLGVDTIRFRPEGVSWDIVFNASCPPDHCSPRPGVHHRYT